MKRFAVRTYGCQMNVHDTEKIANLLYHQGYRTAQSEDDADLLIINTCSVRERAEHKLYSELGKLREWKSLVPGRIVGVGGCVAQQNGDALLKRFAHLDFVFGTHNVRLVPSMVAAAEAGRRLADVRETRSLERFDLPSLHADYTKESRWHAWVTVMEGCDMFCSYCIVPSTRGREISRPAQDIVREVEQLARSGVREIGLLGQTVNAYGRHDLRRGREDETGTMRFAELIRVLAKIPGIDRIRYTSPHPLFFDDELIRTHAEVSELCPHIHMPVQSGSDRILAAMHRRYTADEYRELCAKLRAARPDLALTTDLIVGFPGETETDFQATLQLMRDCAFVDSFSFKYSPRPGTAAEKMENDVSGSVAQERLEALQNLQRELTLSANRARVGGKTQVRVEGASRKGSGQMTGRDPYHRIVNFALPEAMSVEAGSVLEVEIIDATPHSLIAVPSGQASKAVSPLLPIL